MALSHAILASLMQGSCSGYILAKRFDRSIGYFWSATHQQIYRELAQMTAKGWVEFEVNKQTGKPDAKIYSATEAGKNELIEWMHKPSAPDVIREDLLVKIRAGSLIDKKILLAEVEKHRQSHSEKLAVYQKIKQKDFPKVKKLPNEAKLQYMVLRAGIMYEKFFIEWCEEVIQVLQAKDKTFEI
jgi:DNA-binding PadR family transcriptional regulator